MLDKMKNKKINPSIFAIIILVLILICSFVLFFEIKDYRNLKTQIQRFYYYFISDRIEFEGNIMLDGENTIVDLKANGIDITSIPLYYQDNENEMLLPENMEIVYPYKNAPMYKVGKYSKIYIKNNYIYINSEAGIGRLYDCFLYDGENIYVFVENTSIVVGEQRYDLSPMSFVEVTNNYIKIYNKKTNEFMFIENYQGNVEAYTEEYKINLSTDSFSYNSSFYILIKNIEGLDFFEF